MTKILSDFGNNSTYNKPKKTIDKVGAIRSTTDEENLMKSLNYLDRHTGVIDVDISDTKIYSLKTVCVDTQVDMYFISPTKSGLDVFKKNMKGKVYEPGNAGFIPDTVSLSTAEVLHIIGMRYDDLDSQGLMFGFPNLSFNQDANEQVATTDAAFNYMYYVIPHGSFLNDFVKRGLNLGCIKSGRSFYRDMYLADCIASRAMFTLEAKKRIKLLIRLYINNPKGAEPEADIYALGLSAFSEDYDYVSTKQAALTLLDEIKEEYGSYKIGAASVSNNSTVIQIILKEGKKFDYGIKFITSDIGDSSHILCPAIFDKEHNMVAWKDGGFTSSHKDGLTGIKKMFQRFKSRCKYGSLFNDLNSECKDMLDVPITLENFIRDKKAGNIIDSLPKKAQKVVCNESLIVSTQTEAVKALLRSSKIIKDKEIAAHMSTRKNKAEAIHKPIIYDTPFTQEIDHSFGKIIEAIYKK